MSKDALQLQIQAAQEAADLLWHAGVQRRARWIADAASILSTSSSAAQATLATSAGLSEPMIAWGLSTTLQTFRHEDLLKLATAPTPPHATSQLARSGSLAAVILSGNVFTACLKGMAIPLLFGFPLVAKASSRDDLLPSAFANALKEADPELSAAVCVHTFSAHESLLTDTLLDEADVLSVFGSDETVQTLRARAKASTTVIAHGHGLGVAFLSRTALCDLPSAKRVAARLSLDVAAYDQRGCLSPQAVWIERGAQVSSDRFMELLAEALLAQEQSLPRGPLPLDAASAQMTWRAAGALSGTLLEEERFAIALEHEGKLRIGPGYRNVQLLEVDSSARFCEAVSPLGVHLKNIGVAEPAEATPITRGLGPRCAPRITSLGTMQTPSLLSLSDGLAPWEGFVRFTENAFE